MNRQLILSLILGVTTTVNANEAFNHNTVLTIEDLNYVEATVIKDNLKSEVIQSIYNRTGVDLSLPKKRKLIAEAIGIIKANFNPEANEQYLKPSVTNTSFQGRMISEQDNETDRQIIDGLKESIRNRNYHSLESMIAAIMGISSML